MILVPLCCRVCLSSITVRGVERITVGIDKEWLSVADICEYMGVSSFVVTGVIRSGALPAVKFGREWRVAKKDFEEWLNDQRRSATAKTSPS